ncbi:MAG: MASE4 domain-containing protein [Rhodospirillales bacterium]|nr:MASE4 domain-containing protein [Rhodospirillales bacterium]
MNVNQGGQVERSEIGGVSLPSLPGAVQHRIVALTTVEPGLNERRAALGVVALSTLVFAAAAPFAREPLVQVPAFIPAYEAALVICDLITSLLLFGQYSNRRTPGLLLLALGYLFDALIIIPHALSFPGLFAPSGLLGAGVQTTAWLYIFWHGTFPLFVIAFALLEPRSGRETKGLVSPAAQERIAILGIVAVMGFVWAITLLTTSGQHLLPDIMVGHSTTNTLRFILFFSLALCVAAILLLWRRRPASVLDLWLMVVMCAWLFDIALSAILNAGRFDLGFYAGRIYGLFAANFVLAVLLLETGGLYSRLAKEKVDLEDRAEKLSDDLQKNVQERKSAERQLQQAQKMEAIGQLTGGIAHDFNNLLGILIGNLDLIKDRIEDRPEALELADAALDAALRGADLNKRLLAFSRRQTLTPELVDINESISSMFKLLHRSLGERVEIRLALAPMVWPVKIDPTQFETSIVNLSLNARDAMTDGGKLTIETKNVVLDNDYASHHEELKPGEYVMLAISDTGSGMTSEILSRVFDPFFTTKPVGRGTGLGLSMVYGFMKQSGGHTNIYSEPGKGTTVRLYLPRQLEEKKVPAVAEEQANTRKISNELILIVEDNPDMRRIALRQLQELGYQVAEAENADQAMSLLDDGLRPSLLFSDVVMPGKMDGIDLADAVRLKHPGTKVLLTSGFTERATLEVHAREGRQINYSLLGKPYRRDELAKSVRSLLDNGSLTERSS